MFDTTGAVAAPGLTRRQLLRGALGSTLGAGLLLGGCSGISGKLLDEASGLMGGNYVRVFRQAAAARKA